MIVIIATSMVKTGSTGGFLISHDMVAFFHVHREAPACTFEAGTRQRAYSAVCCVVV